MELSKINKKYQQKSVLKNISFNITPGKFVVLLGPSGCGKSTLLKLIAGLEQPDSGEIWLEDKNLTHLSPQARNIAMVFQNYALYPHLSVKNNIITTLKLHHVSKPEIETRYQKIAEMLQIADLSDRKPKQLSGGQQQRVALARALIRDPQLFLLDEPLSNLDAKLRLSTRAEIIKLHQQFPVTTLYVTHDQIEAMTMADEIILMNEGEIVQIGTPDQLYQKPANLFAARFLGSPEMNLLTVQVQERQTTFLGEDLMIDLPAGAYYLGIRPEDLTLTSDNPLFTVQLVENLGNELLVYLNQPNSEKQIIVRAPKDTAITINSQVGLNFSPTALHLFDRTTKKRLDFQVS